MTHRRDSQAVPRRVDYGPDPAQHGILHRPDGASRGVVAVLHGGFWKAEYGAELGEPLARRLAQLGWTAWNLEYRRVRGGGGWPATFDDVHAGLERLAGLDVDTTRVVALGHSAGGHLAAWAAARGRFPRWSGALVPVSAVIAQAGALDLTATFEDDLGSGAAAALMGCGPDDPAYDWADPMRQVPLGVPVWCVHARDDNTVPFAQAEAYVARSTAAGARAHLVEVPGGHFGVIDPDSPAWARIEELLASL